MGNIWCCKRNANKKIVLLLVGLDNAGKTVAAKGLAGETVDIVVPTVGFSVVNLTYLGYTVKVFDLGGGPNIRGIWHRYFNDTYGVIFVVDSSDISRLDEAKLVLQELLSHKKIAGKPVLVLANKQDDECALDEIDIIEKLDLERTVNNYQCPTLVQSCSAVEYSGRSKVDPGIRKGYEWLLQYIARNYDTLNRRVSGDVSEQLAIDAKLRREKIARIRAEKELEMRRRHEEDEIESYSNYERKLNVAEVPQEQQQSSADDDDDDDDDDDGEDGGIDKNGSAILVRSKGRPSSPTLSSTSSDFFPPIYHIPDNAYKEDRPMSTKTAVQFVRQQLEELDNSSTSVSRKPSFVSQLSNKTAPMFLYGTQMPQSAEMARKSYDKVWGRRQLKSAGDVTFRASNFLTASNPSSSAVRKNATAKDDSVASVSKSEVFEMSRLSAGGDGAGMFGPAATTTRFKKTKPVPWTLQKKVHNNGDINGISVVEIN